MDSDASEDERNIPDRASIIRDIQDDRPNHSSDASDASDDDAGGGMMCEEDEPTYLMPRQTDWKTIPEELRRPRNYITTDFLGEDFMRIPENKIFTMDAVSKCWEVIHPESPTLLYDETDGGTWAFCEQCVAQVRFMMLSCVEVFFADAQNCCAAAEEHPVDPVLFPHAHGERG